MSRRRKLVNSVMAAFLRSPLRFLVDRTLMLVTFQGRQTGRWITTPVTYVREDGTVLVLVGHPEQKRWWRNFRGGAPVRLYLRGRHREGRGELLAGNPAALAEALPTALRHLPFAGRMLRVRLGPDGRPDPGDLARAATQAVMIRIHLD